MEALSATGCVGLLLAKIGCSASLLFKVIDELRDGVVSDSVWQRAEPRTLGDRVERSISSGEVEGLMHMDDLPGGGAAFGF